MMKINVLFFGALVDVTGSASLLLDVDSTNNVEALNRQLQGIYPELSRHKYKIAVNQKVAEGNLLLNDNDEVALLPPFAGG